MTRHFIASGQVYHKRLSPVVHEFTYPYFALGLRLDGTQPQLFPLLGPNLLSLCQIRNRDYLFGEDRPIRDMVQSIAEQHGAPGPFEITMLSAPKILGYTFNPVVFYLLEREGQIRHVLVEVNNTYKDRHYYFLSNTIQKAGEFVARHDKEFFVSPFNNLKGYYRFRFILQEKRIFAEMTLVRDEQDLMVAHFQAALQPLNRAHFLRVLVQRNFAPLWSMRRIIHQALVLRYAKKMKALIRPKPDHPHTLQKGRLTWLSRLFRG